MGHAWVMVSKTKIIGTAARQGPGTTRWRPQRQLLPGTHRAAVPTHRAVAGALLFGQQCDGCCHMRLHGSCHGGQTPGALVSVPCHEGLKRRRALDVQALGIPASDVGGEACTFNSGGPAHTGRCLARGAAAAHLTSRSMCRSQSYTSKLRATSAVVYAPALEPASSCCGVIDTCGSGLPSTTSTPACAACAACAMLPAGRRVLLVPCRRLRCPANGPRAAGAAQVAAILAWLA